MLETLSFKMLKNTIMALVLDLCRHTNSKPWIRITQEKPENNLFSFSVNTHRFLPTFESSSHTELSKDEKAKLWKHEQQQTRNQGPEYGLFERKIALLGLKPRFQSGKSSLTPF